MMTTIESLSVLILALSSAFFDGKQRMIPNWLTLGGIGFGIVLSIFEGTTSLALLGLFSASLLCIPYQWGWLGGGDVKLLMAYSMLLGAWSLLLLWLGAALLSVPMAAWMAYKTKQSVRHVGVPYAIPLAVMAIGMVGKGVLYP